MPKAPQDAPASIAAPEKQLPTGREKAPSEVDPENWATG